MVNPIVVVNVSLTQPPAPPGLQRTGAAISQGGTILGVGAYSLITQLADLTPLLSAALSVTGVVWASTYGGQVTATTASPHGIAVNTVFQTTIAGVVPAAYNGTYTCIATGASTFTYYLVSNPGVQTVAGTYTPLNQAELVSMITSFFSQGAQQSVYVLELGAGAAATGIANLQVFIAAQPNQVFYSYLVPRSWDATSQFLALVAQYENPNSRTYFFTTTTIQNYQVYTSAMKSVIADVEAPAYGAWPANLVTNASYSTGLATVTTTTAHTVIPGQYFTLAGINPAGYNGTFQALPGTTGTTLIYAIASNPGAYSSSGSLQQSMYASAGTPATEFSLAVYFQHTLSQDPGPANKVPPFAFMFAFGVTPFPVQGNSALLTSLQAANISFVKTGNQGGLSQNIFGLGHTKDGKPFNYWYAIDWLSINLIQNLSNAVINGSNNQQNPLYYNQDGINRLEQVSYNTGNSGIQAGLFLGTAVQYQMTQDVFNAAFNAGKLAGQLAFNAIPFIPYTTANPNDYPIGKYAGLSCVATPLNGFEQIIFNVDATQFVG